MSLSISAGLAAIFLPMCIGQSYSIQTIAGTTTIKDGIPANTAFLRAPFSAVADASGNIYIADDYDNRVRKIAPSGLISTVAGTGVQLTLGDGGPATLASLNGPFLLALGNNSLYIAEADSHLVRRLDFKTGIITTVAGNGNAISSFKDGTTATKIGMDPKGIAIDSKGNLLISDALNNRIRKVAPDGTTSIIAGLGSCGPSGDNGAATIAQICYPTQLALDGNDNIYFIDYFNSRVRFIDSQTGLMKAYLGDGYPLSVNDGYPPLVTSVAYPDGLAADSAGNLYVSENARIRYVAAGGNAPVRTVAGTGVYGFSGDKGSATAAESGLIPGVFAYSNGDLLLADTSNYRIRKVTAGIINTIAGLSIVDGVAALSSEFNVPTGVAEDSSGNLYIADQYNNRIRKLTASTGTVSTFAGTGLAGYDQGRIDKPEDVAIDSKGFVYFSDSDNDQVIQIQADGSLKIYAGGNGTGYAGEGGFARNAQLNGPRGLAFDSSDNLYICDEGNYRVRKVTSDGLIHLVAGNGKQSYSGDGVFAVNTAVDPWSVTVDASGNLFIADTGNARVRRVDAASLQISTVAGAGIVGSAGDGGLAVNAYLMGPYGVAFDAQHNLLIADSQAGVIRRVNAATGIISTIAGTGVPLTSTEAGAATQVNFNPARMLVEKAGTILVVDAYNDRTRRMTPLVAKTLSINSGDQQSGVAGTSLAISVKVTDSNAYAIQAQPVTFTVTSGTATLSSASAATDITGVAATQVTLGSVVGPVTVRADSTGLSSVTFTLSVAPMPTLAPPSIMSVIGAPMSSPPVTTISPNGTVLVTLAMAGTGGGGVTKAAVLATPYPSTLNSICVSVGGVSAPVYSTSVSSIGIIVPNVPPGPADVIVTAACGTGNDVASAPFHVTVAAASPEFNYGLITPDGLYYVNAVERGTTAVVGNPSAPVTQGDSISIYAVGLGNTSPSENPGDVVMGPSPVTGAVTVTLAGNPLPPEAVTFVGLDSNAAPGQYRIDLMVPVDAPVGDQPITIAIDSAVSPAGLLTIVAPAPQGQQQRVRPVDPRRMMQLRKQSR